MHLQHSINNNWVLKILENDSKCLLNENQINNVNIKVEMNLIAVISEVVTIKNARCYYSKIFKLMGNNFVTKEFAMAG